MKRTTHRYITGDLVTVGDHFNNQGYLSPDHPAGPPIVGSTRAVRKLFKPGDSFLVLKDATPAGWRYNKKLYTEILTSDGPRIVWASHFKKKRCDSE